jgi:hypothetical protein
MTTPPIFRSWLFRLSLRNHSGAGGAELFNKPNRKFVDCGVVIVYAQLTDEGQLECWNGDTEWILVFVCRCEL